MSLLPLCISGVETISSATAAVSYLYPFDYIIILISHLCDWYCCIIIIICINILVVILSHCSWSLSTSHWLCSVSISSSSSSSSSLLSNHIGCDRYWYYHHHHFLLLYYRITLVVNGIVSLLSSLLVISMISSYYCIVVIDYYNIIIIFIVSHCSWSLSWSISSSSFIFSSFLSHHIGCDWYWYHHHYHPYCITLAVIDIDIVIIIIIGLLHHIARDQYDILVLFSFDYSSFVAISVSQT